MLLLLPRMAKMSFGDWLLWRRRSLNISQENMAEALGITRQSVSNWERNKVKPTLEIPQVVTLCNLLDVGLDTLGRAAMGQIEID